MEIPDRLHLRRCETVVGVQVVSTPLGSEMATRVKVAAQRVVDHPVLDTVVSVARCQDGVSQQVHLAHAVELSVPVGVKGERPREVVAKHPLQQPDTHRVHVLVVIRRRPGDDAIEIVRIALRLHQSLSPAGRAPFKV